jgi:hypothetical protein
VRVSTPLAVFAGILSRLVRVQVTSSMAGVVKAMESAMNSMNLEKVGALLHLTDLAAHR